MPRGTAKMSNKTMNQREGYFTKKLNDWVV
jgi:hypothetical protein